MRLFHLAQRLRVQELGAERGHDASGQVVLQREDVPALAVEALRPEQPAVARIRELGSDPEPVASASDTPFQHHRCPQQRPDGTNILVPALERKDRTPGRDLQPLDVGERVDHAPR